VWRPVGNVFWEASSAPNTATPIAIRVEILAVLFAVFPAATAAPNRVMPGRLLANEQASDFIHISLTRSGTTRVGAWVDEAG